MAEPTFDAELNIDLKDIIKVLQKNIGLILSVFLVAVIIAGVASYMLPPTYEAETTLRIKQNKGLASSLLADIPMGSTMATQQLMSTYAEILKSRTVIERVIELTQGGKEKKSTYKDMLQRITTQPVKDTEILKIKVQAGSEHEAQLVANTLVDTFLQRLTSLVRDEQTQVREFIGERLTETELALTKAETTLEIYKRDQKIVAPTEEMKALVDRVSQIDKLKEENEIALVSARARLESVTAKLAQQKGEYIAESPLIQQYRTKLGDLEVKLVGLIQHYTESHPDVLSVRAEIDELKKKLEDEIRRVVNAQAPSANPIYQSLLQSKIQAESEIAAATAQSIAIKEIVDAGEIEIAKLPAKEQGLARLMRDVTVAQEIFVMLKRRYEEARISEVMQPTDVHIIDRAVLPEKAIKPNKRMNIMIGAFLGLFVGVGLAFLLDYMNKTINNADDVKHYLNLPVLGSIPRFDTESSSKGQDVYNFFQNLRDRLMPSGKKKKRRRKVRGYYGRG